MTEESPADPDVSNIVSDSVVGGHSIQIGYVSGAVTILLDRPGYHVEFLTPSGVEAPPESVNRPSYLLDPRHQIVPYRPRQAEETRLREWLESRDDVSALMLAGPGGQGKTRLGSAVASGWHDKGWAIAQAVPNGPQRLATSTENVLETGQPVLVLVDYADRWRLSSLIQLVNDVAASFPARRVRVLMMSRHGQLAWETIAAELERIKLGPDSARIGLPGPIMLGEFTSARVEAFAEAAEAFATRLGNSGRLRVSPPENLSDAAYGSPLTLHMAALAAVYTANTGDAVPEYDDPHTMSRYLLRHERRYWNATGAAPLDASPLTNSVIEEVVWWATLCGPVSGHQAAVELLRNANLADGPAEAGRLVAVHERLYPVARDQPAEDGEPEAATLLPLQPDRLAEDFIGEHLTNNRHTTEKIVRLIGTEEGTPEESTTPNLRRCMIVLGAAASRHRAAAVALCAVLGRRPALAIHGGPTLVQFAADQAPSELAEAVGAELPMYDAKHGPALPKYDADLLGPAADLTRRLVNDLPADAPAQVRAERLLHLGNRLAHLGKHDAAFTAISEATEIYRRLAVTIPGYQPHLAMATASRSNVTIINLMARHVLHENEEITRVRLWPDGIALTTDIGRHFAAGPEPGDWLVSREDWVDDVVIATRDDLLIEGQPERFGFLLLAGGGELYVNDRAAIAELGRRLYDGMDPAAYAQLLVQFHPYSSALRTVLTSPGQLRWRLGSGAVQESDPIQLRHSPAGLVLTFHSTIRYRRPGTLPLLDLAAWTVRVPLLGGPADWDVQLIAKGLRTN